MLYKFIKNLARVSKVLQFYGAKGSRAVEDPATGGAGQPSIS